MKKFILMFVLIFTLTGCSTHASISSDINEELYNDSVGVFNLYTDYIEDGKGSFDEIERKWTFYLTKHMQKAKNMSDSEKELFKTMALLSDSLGRYETSYQKDDREKMKEALNEYTKHSEKLNEILNLK